MGPSAALMRSTFPLSPFLHPPPPKSALSGQGSLWCLCLFSPSFLPLLLFLLLILRAPSPACSHLGAAVPKWVTNTAKKAQAAFRFVQSSGPSTAIALPNDWRRCCNHVHSSCFSNWCLMWCAMWRWLALRLLTLNPSLLPPCRTFVETICSILWTSVTALHVSEQWMQR